jgi:hypothetical protein
MRRALAQLAIGCVFCSLGICVSAQNSCQKDEIFGGYAWLAPNGWGDLDYKINNIPNAFDASNTYYLPNARNIGLLLDGSGHFNGGTTPPNLENGSNNSTAVGYVLGGLQYKFHSDKVSPFVRGFVGGASLSPDCCGGTQWSFAAGGGGGLDLNVKPRFSIRLAQVDYIYSNYDHRFQTTHPTQWNSVRVAAGVVFNLGNYCTLPVSCTASAAPTEVMAGEPVKLTATGTNFDPKHTVTYSWTANGGKLSSAATQSTEIDTTGLAPGSYTANATITDPKLKKMNSSTCAAAFVVKQPPPPVPPVVSCTVTPATIAVGESATVTMTASSADRRPLTYNWSTTGGQLDSNDTTSTVTASNADAGHTITVTGTATDDRSLSASCSVQVSVPAIKTCVNIEDWGSCTFEKNPKKPWRVDNDCKDTLDKLALRLQQMPNGKLDIVGYTNEKEVVNEQTLGAQRSVNVKYYLTTDGPTKIDAGRLRPRQGGTKGQVAHFYFKPDGILCAGQVEEGTAVDETNVQPQSRTAPAAQKKSKSAKPIVAPAQ